MEGSSPKMSKNTANVPGTGRSTRSHARATLVELAAAAGVSTATASRALNTPHLLSRDTLARVHAAIASTGYIPSLIGSAAISNRSRLVAMLIPESTLAPFESTIRAVVTELGKDGYQAVFGIYSRASTREQIVTQMLSRRPEGMILIGMPVMAGTRDLMIAAGLPIVETWEIPSEPLDMVAGISHADCGTALGEFILAKGYRRIQLLDTSIGLVIQRHDRIAQVLTDAGWAAPVRTRVSQAASVVEGRRTLARMASGGELPEAIVCADDLLAHGVLIEAAMRGIRIPEDLAVLGFGDLDYMRDLEPPLTTISISGEAIGRAAAGLMLLALRGERPLQRTVDVGFTLMERGTT